MHVVRFFGDYYNDTVNIGASVELNCFYGPSCVPYKVQQRRQCLYQPYYSFLSLILFLLIEGERARVHAKTNFVGFSHFSFE